MADPALGCPHDYVLTPFDLERLAQAELLVINGSGLEGYLDQALKVARSDLKVIDATLLIDPNAQDIGAQPPIDDKYKNLDGPLNPHMFNSPRLAVKMLENICRGLSEYDPKGAGHYTQNLHDLTSDYEELEQLIQDTRQVTAGGKIITSHEVFDYMAQDLGLTVVARLEPVEAGHVISAASFGELAQTAKSNGIRAIWVAPTDDVKLAAALGRESGLPVVVVDPISSGPAAIPENYYQKVITQDLEVIKAVFSASPDLGAAPSVPK